MIQILRKYNKKILAVVGVFLMISFIADLGIRRYNRQLRESASPGKIGDKALTADEYQYAFQAWKMLRSRDLGYEQIVGFSPDGQPQRVLLSVMDIQLTNWLAAAMPAYYRQMAAQQALTTSREILYQLDPLTFLLLLKEADRMNIRIPDDELERYVQAVAGLPTDDPDFRRIVLRDWLRVFEAYVTMTNAVKVTPAMGIHLVAKEEQEIALKLVEFKAADFKSKVAPPTTQQIDQFFQEHKNTDPETNEFGIGYRYPNRLKIEYVRIPFLKIRERISDEDVYEFWKRNQYLFPTTQPAETQPASTNPATQPLAVTTTRPTTRPWTEVKDQIRDRLARELAAIMAKNTLQSFNADWAAYRQGLAAKQAPDAITTALGVPFDSKVYLRKLTEHVQTLKDSRMVLPETVQEGEWLNKQELADLPGIGKSAVRAADNRSVIPFADFAISRASAFLTDAQKKKAQENQAPVLAPLQPSQPFQDPDGNFYIFRITAADPVHPASSITGLETRVRNDWILLQAFNLAKEAARKSLDTAKTQGIDAAAKAAGDLPVIDTGLFFSDPRFPITKYNLPAPAKPKFLDDAFALLYERLKTGNQHPIAVIDLPKAATSIVARLEDAKPAIEHSYFPQRVADMQRMLQGQRATIIAVDWFNPDAIKKRLDFKPNEDLQAPSPRRELPDAPPPLGM